MSNSHSLVRLLMSIYILSICEDAKKYSTICSAISNTPPLFGHIKRLRMTFSSNRFLRRTDANHHLELLADSTPRKRGVRCGGSDKVAELDARGVW